MSRIEVVFRVMGLAYLLTIQAGALVEELLPEKNLKHGHRSESLFKKDLVRIMKKIDGAKISLNKPYSSFVHNPMTSRLTDHFYEKLLSYS